MMQKRRDIIINVLKNETQLWRVAFNPTIVKCIFAINRAMMGWVSNPNETLFLTCILNIFIYKKHYCHFGILLLTTNILLNSSITVFKLHYLLPSLVKWISILNRCKQQCFW